ncbi:iron-containing alcohol dehydrogenase [uncultured Hoeflea sp.]|uniref:iron-containing alcohol dehydrogenase n=1 Tax=uncultured Hoeflea sp. TaxID=538666 RepID=UPI002611483D|nr:iron-containing alcohol dehydrogenase [uncultured Hoeflea sp.]
MQPFVFNTTARLICRPGAATELGALTGGILGADVLFVTDPGLRALGLERAAIASLENQGARVTVFDAVEADPSLSTLHAAIDMARAAGATGLVGFGGGSSMDVAKLAALLAGSGEDLEAAWGVGNAKGPRLPLVLVPTTAGTGSEATPVSIITVGENEKRGVSSPLLLPDVAVLDADLTLGLPAPITAATGIDAMVHAIEAYASKSANNNPLSAMLAREAMSLLGANIETVVLHEPGNRTARQAMLLGSMLAGMAFGNSPVAAVHALAYPIGGMFHIPHGLSNALVLPEVLKFNIAEEANQSWRRYAELAPLAFPDLNGEASPALAADFITGLADLSARLGLPQRLSDCGIGEEALPNMASEAMKQTRLLVNNPREVSEADALAIYRAAW